MKTELRAFPGVVNGEAVSCAETGLGENSGVLHNI